MIRQACGRCLSRLLVTRSNGDFANRTKSIISHANSRMGTQSEWKAEAEAGAGVCVRERDAISRSDRARAIKIQ